ncbi:MAG: VaFE repeat-containing surface-anchored protein, partial [Actinomycetota bacterium]
MRRSASGVEPIGASTTVEVTADATCTSIDMLIDIPADVLSPLAGSTLVVFQHLTVASSARVVAVHNDPLDPDQTVLVPAITTSLRAVRDELAAEARRTDEFLVVAGDLLVDRLVVQGLLPDVEYTATATLARRHADGTCTDGAVVSATSFVASGASTVDDAPVIAGVDAGADHEASADFSDALVVDVPAGMVPGAGVFAVSQRIVRADDPDGSAVVVHDGCNDDEQTVWALGIDTAVEEPVVTGAGVMRDRVTVSGLDVPPPGVATVSVEGGLFAHGDRNERAEWACVEANRVASFAVPLPTASDPGGELERAMEVTVWTPGESHGVGWHSYDVRVVITFDDGTTWASGSHGCQVPAESFRALSPPLAPTTTSGPATTPPATAPPSTMPPTTIAVTTIPLPTTPLPTPPPSTAGTVPPTVAARPLPTTGGGGTTRLTIAVAGLLLAVGAVTLAASRRT